MAKKVDAPVRDSDADLETFLAKAGTKERARSKNTW